MTHFMNIGVVELKNLSMQSWKLKKSEKFWLPGLSSPSQSLGQVTGKHYVLIDESHVPCLL
jgi:hypothetical protein